ncbi:MAG: hypothetical protein LEGION0403_FIIPPAGN_00796 [Legionella sp.]|uniref:hypothetical protein n=1 Tax=Legionella sp. TaxID=459 RepID=UPI003D0F6992
MKINESLPQCYGQSKQQTNQQSPADFEHWLNNPAKQSTGDEYYWQHQTQLQHSELHFDAKPLQAPKTEQALTKENEQIFHTHVNVQETQHFELQSTLITTMDNTASSHSPENKFMPFMTKLEQALEQSSLPMPIHSNQFTQDTSAVKKAAGVSKSMTTTTQFKNNHMFIQGEQAELTLNLHTLDKQEQNELVQLIQNYLKKKGLVLSRLIINGVNNDRTS